MKGDHRLLSLLVVAASVLLLLILAVQVSAHGGAIVGTEGGFVPASDDGSVELIPPPIDGSTDKREPSQAEYQLAFDCPDAGTDGEASCPYYVLDENDALSQPILMVDPGDRSLMAWNAMHGGHGLHPGPNDEAPTNRSRDNGVHQPHTTFRTTDGGGTWEDMPYYAPAGVDDEDRQVHGVNNAATMDSKGRIYLASLYAYRESAGPLETPGDFKFAVGLWKAGRATQPVDYTVNNIVIDSGNDGENAIDAIDAIAVPDANRVIVMWRESPGDGTPFLRGVWTKTGGGAQWETLGQQESLLGPCTTTSEPLVFNGSIYIGCRPAPGDPLEIHTINATDGTATPRGEVNTSLNQLQLVQRSPVGHMGLVASGLEGGTPSVELSYGLLGENWTAPTDIADELTFDAPGGLAEARVTAAEVRPETGNLHLIYMERHRQDQPAGQGAAEYRKVFASVRGTEMLASEEFQMSQLTQAPIGATPGREDMDIFSDLQDGIVVWEDPQTGEEKEFVAFGDHGYVRFGQVIIENPPPPIALVGNPITPTAVASGTSTSVLYAVGAGALSLAMVARMLYSRSETTTEVEAKE